jgi:hypothetical protein
MPHRDSPPPSHTTVPPSPATVSSASTSGSPTVTSTPGVPQRHHLRAVGGGVDGRGAHDVPRLGGEQTGRQARRRDEQDDAGHRLLSRS